MVEVNSLVVSDNFAHAASNSAIEISGEGDIMFTDWEGYLNSSFEQDVIIFDFNLYAQASEKSGTGRYHITEHKDKFKALFESFASTLRLHLKTGDSIVILDGTELYVETGGFGRRYEQTSSRSWVDQLGVLEGRQYITDWVPEVQTEVEPAFNYLQTVSNHYSYETNSSVVKDPELLATSPKTGNAAAFATNEIMNKNGKRVEVDGNLAILPQPSVINKPRQLMRFLVDTGWHFHEDDRTDQIQSADQGSKTTLSIPMGELDDDLVERCWSKYARGEYRDAASRACQLLEHRVREAVGDEHRGRSGASLMKHAFSPEGGPLAMGEKPGEKEGVMHLYAGAIQGIWNPLHHRPSGNSGEKYLDGFGEQEAHDVISYVNFLLSLLPEEETEE